MKNCDVPSSPLHGCTPGRIKLGLVPRETNNNTAKLLNCMHFEIIFKYV